MTKILVVEDNKDLAFGLRNNLEIEGFEVEVAEDGEEGVRVANLVKPDLVILDLMIPKMDGFRVLHALRSNGFEKPVLILTARGEESDKVRGLRLGADDYVTKPFGVLELLARVEALLRRTQPNDEIVEKLPAIEFGDINIDQSSRTVHRCGEPVSLTPKEYELLLALLKREGAVASRIELMKEVWGYHAAVLSRTVDTHIAELRKKLEPDHTPPKHILTIRKVGYRLNRA
jgi:two-component system alkaline phosphatase synthesis response regulator PhoP